MKKIITVLAFFFYSILSFAQSTENVEMADAMRSSGKIYVVIATIAVVFIGIALYLFLIDRRLTKIEKESK